MCISNILYLALGPVLSSQKEGMDVSKWPSFYWRHSEHVIWNEHHYIFSKFTVGIKSVLPQSIVWRVTVGESLPAVITLQFLNVLICITMPPAPGHSSKLIQLLKSTPVYFRRITSTSMPPWPRHSNCLFETASVACGVMVVADIACCQSDPCLRYRFKCLYVPRQQRFRVII